MSRREFVTPLLGECYFRPSAVALGSPGGDFVLKIWVLGGELPTARKWVITPVIYMG